MGPNLIALRPILAQAVVGLVAFCSMAFLAEAADQKPDAGRSQVERTHQRTHAKKGQIRRTPKSARNGHSHGKNAHGEPLPESSEKTDETDEKPLSEATDAVATSEKKPLPEFPQIEKAAAEYFAKLPDYQPGGVITRPEAEGFFASLETLGWNPDNRQEILAKVPPPDDFLVEELRTRSGKKFMGRIATYPEALDRLDRLSQLAYGKRHVKGLVNGRGGDQWIKYITTDKRGIELSRSMSRAKNGADFDKPTGRVYTVQMLLDELEASHKKAKQVAPVLEPVARSPKRLR